MSYKIMLVQHSNQLNYEATPVGSWSFAGSNVAMMHESLMVEWYMKSIIYWIALTNTVVLCNALLGNFPKSYVWYLCFMNLVNILKMAQTIDKIKQGLLNDNTLKKKT